MSLLTLSQRCDTAENESCADVGFRRCDNVAVWRYQDVTTTLLQRLALDFYAILQQTILISFLSSKRERVKC